MRHLVLTLNLMKAKQIDSQSNQPQTSMTKNDQQNPKKIGEHATNGINAKRRN